MTEVRKKSFKSSFLFNLLIILGLCVVLYFVFFASLSFFTNHGQETKVSKVVGMTVAKAMATMETQGFEIQVDSTFEQDKKPLTVIRQLPEAGDVVKKGRIIILVVNMAAPPKTPMPNLTNLSYRSAVLIIKSNRLVLADTVMVPFPFKYVIKQQINGEDVSPGSMVAQGSRITLLIGDGEGNTEMNVPVEIIGMPLIEALEIINASGLLAIPIQSDVLPADSSLSIVYKISPHPYDVSGAPTRIREGNSIDIYHKQNPTEEELQDGRAVPQMMDDPLDDPNFLDANAQPKPARKDSAKSLKPKPQNNTAKPNVGNSPKPKPSGSQPKK